MVLFQDQKRKVDFVLVFEEDKKDADIEIPKVEEQIVYIVNCKNTLLSKELEGTELGVAAAAQQFK